MSDGLSIPFFNLGQTVSRNVSLTTTFTNRSRSSPDWILNVNRIPVTPQEPTSEVQNVTVHEAAIAVTTSAKETLTSVLWEDHVHIGSVNHIAVTPQDPTSEVSVHEAASPVTSTKDSATSILRQGHVYTGLVDDIAVTQEPISKVPVHDPITSAKTTPASILRQEYIHTDPGVELPSATFAPPQTPGIETDIVEEERIVKVDIDETAFKNGG